MDQQEIFLTILGMTAVTYLPRLLPGLLLSSRPLPGGFAAWLRYVPIAVLSAMLMPSLILDQGRPSLGLENLELWAAVPTVIVAVLTRSLFATVIAGMAVIAAARYVTGA